MNGCVQSAAAIIEIKIKYYTYQWRIEIRIEKKRDVKYLIFLHPKINFLNTLLRSNQKSNNLQFSQKTQQRMTRLAIYATYFLRTTIVRLHM